MLDLVCMMDVIATADTTLETCIETEDQQNFFPFPSTHTS